MFKYMRRNTGRLSMKHADGYRPTCAGAFQQVLAAIRKTRETPSKVKGRLSASGAASALRTRQIHAPQLCESVIRCQKVKNQFGRVRSPPYVPYYYNASIVQTKQANTFNT